MWIWAYGLRGTRLARVGNLQDQGGFASRLRRSGHGGGLTRREGMMSQVLARSADRDWVRALRPILFYCILD